MPFRALDYHDDKRYDGKILFLDWLRHRDVLDHNAHDEPAAHADSDCLIEEFDCHSVAGQSSDSVSNASQSDNPTIQAHAIVPGNAPARPMEDKGSLPN
jgi:hypothetical protein